MKLNDFETQVIATALAEHSHATLGQVVQVLDEEACAALDAIDAGDRLGVCQACTRLLLASALLLERSGFSWTAALLDVISSHGEAAPRRRHSA